MNLYDATVPQYLQMLGAVAGLLTKAEEHCTQTGTAPAEVINDRLCADMFPFAYQVKSTAVHSAGAIAALANGVFSPDMTEPPADFAGLRARVTDAIAALQAVDPDALNAMADAPMRFEMRGPNREIRLPFTAATFLLSFSQPNFYFHATTTYALLRARGVAVGKIDFLGQMQLAQ